MVDLPALRTAKISLWADASSDWRALAADLGDDAEDLNANVAPVTSPGIWDGKAAAGARVQIAATVAAFQTAQHEANLMNDALQRLADAISACQQKLAKAEKLARGYRLTITQDGSVVPLGSSSPQTKSAVTQVQQLVNDVRESATKADAVAAAKLSLIAGSVTAVSHPGTGPAGSRRREPSG